MRQRDWLRCSDPERMIDSLWRLQGYISNRPYSLFVLTAGQRLWAEQGAEALGPTVRLARRLADGEANQEEVGRRSRDLERLYHEACVRNDWHLCRLVNVLSLLLANPPDAARTLVFPHPMNDPQRPPEPMLLPEELKQCCYLIREFFGTRGGQERPDPTWLTSAVVGLARGIYDDHAFDRLPVLSDALEDAGCNDKNVLAHCRGKGPHVRGCWVVDLFTGRR